MTTVEHTFIRCEDYVRSSSSRCDKPAAFAIMRQHYSGDGYVSHPEAVCKRHAGIHRRYGAAILPLDETTTATIKARLNEAKQRQLAVAAEKQRQRDERERAAAERAWAELPLPYVMTLDIEERARWIERTDHVVSIKVHRIAESSDSWDVVTVELADSEREPAYARVLGGSPMTLTPEAAAVLAEAIGIVAAWAEELNEGGPRW